MGCLLSIVCGKGCMETKRLLRRCQSDQNRPFDSLHQRYRGKIGHFPSRITNRQFTVVKPVEQDFRPLRALGP